VKRYVYLGDRWTDPRFVSAECVAVLNERGKCICGRNASMLVTFAGQPVVVLRRRLRKV
jgi:hypothetical protein